MIKWAWYWKSLKLLSFGLLISFFTLFVGSSVNAVWVTTLVWVDSFTSPVNSWYTLTALKWWGVLTNFLWVWKSVLALDSQRIFWRTPNWYPYVYLKWQSRTVQWFFDRYYSCDLIDVGSPSNCTEVLIDYSWSTFDFDYQVFTTFFNSVIAWEKFYVFSDDYLYVGATYDEMRNAIDICWNSDEIWHSFCFKWWYCYWSRWDRPSACDFWNLVYSQWYDDLKFSNIPLGSIWYAPWQVWYGWQYWGSEWWWVNGEVDWFLTGSIITQECTVWYAKNYAENLWLNRFVCYWWLDIDASQYAIATAWTGATVFQIFQNSNNWLNFSDWFTYRNNIYKNRYTYDSSVWSWTPAPLYSYFQFYNEYGSQFSVRDIQDYCKIIVNNMSLTWIWNWNQSRCPSIVWNNVGWWWGSSWGDDDFSGWVVWWWWGSTFNNVISVNWDWVWNHSTNEVKTPSAYITDFFNKAREVIPTNFTWIWGLFLPTYIIIFFCAIILFRFLRH